MKSKIDKISKEQIKLYLPDEKETVLNSIGYKLDQEYFYTCIIECKTVLKAFQIVIEYQLLPNLLYWIGKANEIVFYEEDNLITDIPYIFLIEELKNLPEGKKYQKVNEALLNLI